MDDTRNHHVKKNKPDPEKQISHTFIHIQNINKSKMENTIKNIVKGLLGRRLGTRVQKEGNPKN